MKKRNVFSTLTIAMFSIAYTHAQDTIFKKNGDVIVAKIAEINPLEVKYKRFDFQSGPVYIELKSNIQRIKYSNGLTEILYDETKRDDYYPPPSQVNNPVYAPPLVRSNKIEVVRSNKYEYMDSWYGERGIQNIMLDKRDAKITSLVMQAKEAKGLQYIGFATIPFGIGALVCWANHAIDKLNGGIPQHPNAVTYGVICLTATIACPILSHNFKQKRKHKTLEAIKAYNDKYGN